MMKGGGKDFGLSWAKGKTQGQLMLMVDPAYKVWIGNLSETTKWKDLQTFLDQAGKTKWVEVFAGKGSGTGAAVYGEIEEVEKAVAMLHGKEIDGRVVVVDPWVKQEKPEGEDEPQPITAP